MTNLHLLNTRGEADAVRARMGPEAWEGAMGTCEPVMRCFPGSLYAGIDLLITPDFRRHAVLEVNAFGDLLPGVLSRRAGHVCRPRSRRWSRRRQRDGGPMMTPPPWSAPMTCCC